MDLSNESDDQLLARMGQAGSYAGGFEAAWAEFHRRHYPYLYRVCFRACRHGDRHEGARDLANATFKRILESKAKFNPPEDLPAEEMPLVVKAWLSRIATRLATIRVASMKSRSQSSSTTRNGRTFANGPGELLLGIRQRSAVS